MMPSIRNRRLPKASRNRLHRVTGGRRRRSWSRAQRPSASNRRSLGEGVVLWVSVSHGHFVIPPDVVSVSIPRSLPEWFCGSFVGVGCEKHMVIWIFPSESVEADLLSRQIDFGADQAATPGWADVECLIQYGGSARQAGDPDEDDNPSQWVLQIELPIRRKQPPLRGVFDTHGMSVPVCGDEAFAIVSPPHPGFEM